MNSTRFTCLGIIFLFVGLLSGCGDGNSGTSGSRATLEASQLCIDCHADANDPVVANAKITEEWKSSKHRSEIVGAGCIDCHEPQVGHPNVCNRCHGGTPTALNATGSDVVRNPDAERKCYKCHGAKTLSSGHFTNNTSANAPGSFVSRNYANNCRACHNPHDVTTLMSINKDWAKSGHGDPNGVAWKTLDFKGAGRTACTRCHTATGYINYVTGAATAFPAKNWGETGGKTKEVLACNACHESYDFKNSVRRLTAFTAPYGGSTATPGGVAQMTFPDVGESNLCISCHAGRESGATLVANATKTGSAKTAHYLAAAAVFYGKGGFQFYTSGVRYNTYGAAGKIGQNANWSHGKLGMDNYITTTDATVVNSGVITNSGNKGQCVACHMGPANTHSFSPLVTANATQGTSPYTQGCYGCHNGIVGVIGSRGAVGMTMAEFIEEEKIIWERMFDFYTWQLTKFGIFFHDNSFYTTATGTNNFTNWTVTVGTIFGGTGAGAAGYDWQNTMGTAMNLHLLVNEKGSFMHNRSFGRALISDSLTWLQKADMSNRGKKFASQNAVFKFTDYSTAVSAGGTYATTGVYSSQFSAAKPVSITTLKSYLVSGSSPNYTRR